MNEDTRSEGTPNEAARAEDARFCVDVISPTALRKMGRMEGLPDLDAEERIAVRAILVTTSQWPNGSTLRVRFMGGSATDHETVKQVAGEWPLHANLKLVFNDAPDAEIRISFVQDNRSWSYMGTDCLNIPRHAATMNFGWPLEEGTILHEFGHAVGLAHEHQNPQGGIQWNEVNVIRDLSGSPNFWDEATIRHNVLDKYRSDQIKGTDFDPQSIMLYSFPKAWTLNGFQAASNEVLSAVDKQFIGSPQGYPFPQAPTDTTVVELPVIDTTGIAGEISRGGRQTSTNLRLKRRAATPLKLKAPLMSS